MSKSVWLFSLFSNGNKEFVDLVWSGRHKTDNEDLIPLINTLHTALLCLYVADPATFSASNSVVRTSFSSQKNSVMEKMFEISSPKLHSAPLKCGLELAVQLTTLLRFVGLFLGTFSAFV